jgi:hypothetical protein
MRGQDVMANSLDFLRPTRIEDGRIVETWNVEDIAGMLGQLGLMSNYTKGHSG